MMHHLAIIHVQTEHVWVGATFDRSETWTCVLCVLSLPMVSIEIHFISSQKASQDQISPISPILSCIPSCPPHLFPGITSQINNLCLSLCFQRHPGLEGAISPTIWEHLVSTPEFYISNMQQLTYFIWKGNPLSLMDLTSSFPVNSRAICICRVSGQHWEYLSTSAGSPSD